MNKLSGSVLVVALMMLVLFSQLIPCIASSLNDKTVETTWDFQPQVTGLSLDFSRTCLGLTFMTDDYSGMKPGETVGPVHMAPGQGLSFFGGSQGSSSLPFVGQPLDLNISENGGTIVSSFSIKHPLTGSMMNENLEGIIDEKMVSFEITYHLPIDVQHYSMPAAVAPGATIEITNGTNTLTLPPELKAAYEGTIVDDLDRTVYRGTFSLAVNGLVEQIIANENDYGYASSASGTERKLFCSGTFQYDVSNFQMEGTFNLTKHQKEFMVTFDDGPVAGQTDKIVDALRTSKLGEKPVIAGFFMVSNNDPRYHSWFEHWSEKGSAITYPTIVQKVASEGHVVGIHTAHHAYFGEGIIDDVMGSDFLKQQMEDPDFVRKEISEAQRELAEALAPIGKAPALIFRPPYVVDTPRVRDGASGYQLVWGKLVGDANWFLGWTPSVEDIKDNAFRALQQWDFSAGPCVLIFHDIRPVTYDNIKDILLHLQNNKDENFTLVNFAPSKLQELIDNPRQALTVVAHSPVELKVIDPDGLIIDKNENQIANSFYKKVDNGNGSSLEFIYVPERKTGNYQVFVTPKVDALSTDVYSLEFAYEDQDVVLAKSVQIKDLPKQPYIISDGKVALNTTLVPSNSETPSVSGQVSPSPQSTTLKPQSANSTIIIAGVVAVVIMIVVVLVYYGKRLQRDDYWDKDEDDDDKYFSDDDD
jgi:peptidoglycan/xylan/chitin deacetylase (PgdA/CDA1 family)